MSSPASSMAAFSIHSDLLGGDSPSNEPGAIKLVRLLLRVAANTAVDAPDNLFTGFSIVKTAREICDAIKTNLDDIDKLDVNDILSDEAAWEVFDKNVQDILDLERRLLRSDLLTSTHKSIQEVESVADYLLEIPKWETDRQRLEQELKDLHNILKGVTKSDDSRFSDSEQKCDDAAMLRKLVDTLVAPGSNPNGSGAAVKELKEKLLAYDLSTKDSDHRAYCIKAAWVVHAAVLELDNSSDQDRTNHLRTQEVWDGVIKFANFLATGNSAIDTEYDILEKLLRGDVKYLECLTIYSHLHYRQPTASPPPLSHASQDLEKTMVRKYSDPNNAKSAGVHYATAENALKAAVTAVTEAVDAVNSVLPGFTIDDAKNTKANDAFKEAIKQLLLLPPEYQEAVKIDVDLQNASTEDNDHFSQVKAKCTSAAATPPAVAQSRDVTIKSGGSERTIAVPNTTKIGALVWSAEFTGATTNDEWVDPQMAVKDTAPGEPTLVLVLTR